ncbi:MAG: outer membrane beta-barrel protein [Paludibacteraceae bacterium]
MKKFLFLSMMVFCVAFVNAQSKSELQIGLAMPQGDFADDDADDAIYSGAGVASTGFYVGYKLLSPLKVEGLFWTFNLGIMYNDLQGDFKDELEDKLEDADDYSLPKYLNVPALVGLQYEKSLSDGFKLYGEAGLGVNLLKLTNFSMSAEDYEYTHSFSPSIQLGYKIGAGIVLKDKYTIGLSYNGLGSHKVKYKEKEESDGDSDSENGKFDKALSVSSLNITVGIRF